MPSTEQMRKGEEAKDEAAGSEEFGCFSQRSGALWEVQA